MGTGPDAHTPNDPLISDSLASPKTQKRVLNIVTRTSIQKCGARSIATESTPRPIINCNLHECSHLQQKKYAVQESECQKRDSGALRD